MRLLAISDLHIGARANLEALEALPAYKDDWLIVAGDVGDTFHQLALGFEHLTARFAKVFWVPGNHELWCTPHSREVIKGEPRYRMMVELARRFGVITPEDPYVVWEGPGGPAIVAPLFLLYDYSFRPAEVSYEDVLAWAAEAKIEPADELLLDPAPFASRTEWCHARLAATAARLGALDPAMKTVLVNHYPLLQQLVRLWRVPRFAPWCGTRLTADWPARFNALACVYGHLHVRGSETVAGVRHHEVSLGYPRQWDQARGLAPYIRQILPALPV